MRTIDRVFGWLLILSSCGHTAGTLLGYPMGSQIFVWSLGASLAGALLGALNVVRAGRPPDKTISAIAGIGTICWACLALAFGQSIGQLLDPRVVGNVLIAAVLAMFSLAALGRDSPHSTAAAP